jgi:hypothetical protein
LDAITSFSHLPLQLSTYAGLLFAGVAFVAIPVVIALHFAGSYLPGFGTITIIVLLIGGMILLALGVIGEYVARIYDEVKHRPLYIVREERNRPDGAGPAVAAVPNWSGLSPGSELPSVPADAVAPARPAAAAPAQPAPSAARREAPRA